MAGILSCGDSRRRPLATPQRMYGLQPALGHCIDHLQQPRQHPRGAFGRQGSNRLPPDGRLRIAERVHQGGSRLPGGGQGRGATDSGNFVDRSVAGLNLFRLRPNHQRNGGLVLAQEGPADTAAAAGCALFPAPPRTPAPSRRRGQGCVEQSPDVLGRVRQRRRIFNGRHPAAGGIHVHRAIAGGPSRPAPRLGACIAGGEVSRSRPTGGPEGLPGRRTCSAAAHRKMRRFRTASLCEDFVLTGRRFSQKRWGCPDRFAVKPWERP